MVDASALGQAVEAFATIFDIGGPDKQAEY